MRTPAGRQRNSARHYLDLTAVPRAVDATLGLANTALGFRSARIYITDGRNDYLLAERGQRSDKPSVSAPGSTVTTPGQVFAPLEGREKLNIGFVEFSERVEPHVPYEADIGTYVSIIEDLLDLQRRRPRTPADPSIPLPQLPAAVYAPDVADSTDESVGAGRIVPYYQPVVDLATGAVAGFEALARWHHPVLGTIAPSEFLPTAEESDVILDLDLTVLARGAADVHRWRRQHGSLRLNANLSARHLHQPDCVDRITDVVVSAGLAPADVTLEITETTAVGLDAVSKGFVQALRVRGFTVWLDDLGVGWSSLERLLGLPVDGIKLDHKIGSAAGSPVGGAIVRAIARIASDSDLASTVEGVETADDVARAHEAGFRFGQGYFWSRPVPAADAAAVVARIELDVALTDAATVEAAIGIVAERDGRDVDDVRASLPGEAAAVGLDPSDYASGIVDGVSDVGVSDVGVSDVGVSDVGVSDVARRGETGDQGGTTDRVAD